MKEPARATHDESDSQASAAFRTGASLVLCLHLFCVGIAIAANLAPSALMADLLRSRVLARYLTYFNFDLDYTPYHLTHATIQDVDDRVEVLPAGSDADDPDEWIVLPDAGWRGSDRYKRYQRLAETLSFFAEQEDPAGRIAQSVAEHFLNAEELEPRQIRSRKHLLLQRVALSGSASQRDPDRPDLFRVPYAANVIVAGNRVEVIRVSEQAEVASPETP